MSFAQQHFHYPQSMQPANGQEGFGEFLDGLRRRRRLIALFTILALLAGLLFLYEHKRQFEAQAMLLVQPNDPYSRDVPAPIASQEALILSTVEMLKSRNVIDAVVKELKLGNNRSPDEAVALDLTKHLSIKPVGRSSIITVTYRHPDAELSAKTVNTLIDIYQKTQLQQKTAEAEKTEKWLNKHFGELSEKAKLSAQAIETYRIKENLPSDPKIDVTAQQIETLTSQLMAARSEEASSQASWSQLQSALQEKQPLDTISMGMNSRLVTMLKRDESALLAQQAELQSKYGDNHPRIKAVQAELGEIRAKKERELKNVSQNMRNDLSVLQAKVEALQTALAGLQERRKLEDASQTELSGLEREAKADRMLYQNFFNRYKEITLSDGLLQPDVKIISDARIPTHRTGSPILAVLFLSTLTGFILGVIAALLAEQMENGIRTPRQLHLLEPPIPTLAMIPESPHKNAAALLTDHPDDAATEAIRSLRNAVSAETPQVIAVTSTTSGEGKSLTALWLARSLALSGADVLLVDGNTRSPGLASYLKLDPAHSVSEILLGRKNVIGAVIRDDTVPNLSLLIGKKSEQGDIDLITHAKIRDFITALQPSYAYIIIDTPAILSAAETKLWLQAASKCLYLVRWNKTSLESVRTTVKNIIADNIQIAGFVLSRMDAKELG